MKLPDENHLKDLQKNRIAEKLAAEFAGTFALVFAGTGAIIINDLTGGRITHLGVATTFGLIVLILILYARRYFGSYCKSRRLLHNSAKCEHL